MIKKHRLGNSRAIILLSDGNDKLEDISKTYLTELLKTHGAIIFRGFNISLDQYSNFIGKKSIKVTCDPARKTVAGNSQLIQAGLDAQGFHCENATLPFWPHLQWFYCNVAPKIASQTTLCDGYEAWNCLRDSSKELFLSKRIQISRNIPENLWKKYLSVEFNIPVDQVNESHLKLVSNKVPGQSYLINYDKSVYSSLLTYAAHKTIFSDNIVFANSILTPSYNYEKPSISFEKNEEIPEEIMKEIIDVTDKLTIEIDWEPQDMVVIDNTSVMHGRRKILDANREIYGAQSYLTDRDYNIAQ